MLLRWFEHSQVYHPDRVMSATGAELGRPFEDVNFKASDGTKLNGWFFPSNPRSSRAHLAVMLCHGNAGNISSRLEMCAALLETGVNVFAFDYRGYGRSEGRPTEEGTYLDAQAAHQWLQQKGFRSQDIIVFGESLGGGIASELALREPLGGLVLQSTFSCMTDIGSELFPWLPVRWMSTIKYETCGKLPRLKIPVLVMHSRGDELVRFHHSEKNFAAANEPKLFWELKGDHNSPLTDRHGFIAGMEKFLGMVEKAEAGAAKT
jgi:pimeloyl-ACP methyl ester carboxylesterase